MILQKLCVHYEKLLETNHPNYAPPGMELKRIHFVLLLSEDGRLIDIEQPQTKTFVIKSRSRSGKDADQFPNYLWDNLGFVLGYGTTDKQQSLAQKQHLCFTQQVLRLHEVFPLNKTFAAVEAFYHNHVEQIRQHQLWETITSKTGHNLTFRLAGEELLATQQPELLQFKGIHTHQRECLVSGESASIAALHPKIYLPGGSPTGSKLISFTKGCGYDSYGKHGGENAPISVQKTEAYAAALTGLLQQGSSHSVVVGEVTFLFFTLPHTDFSERFRQLIDPSQKVDRNKLLDQMRNTPHPVHDDAEFVLMALVPNATRISIRLYLRTTIGQLCRDLSNFYNEITIEYNGNTTTPMPLLMPLFASPQQNVEKFSPQLIVDYLHATITCSTIPARLQTILLTRLRQSKELNLSATMLLRYYLNQNKKTPNQYIPMALDKENNKTGYLLGRMFAILERAQELSRPGTNFTLRDTHYTTASVTPSTAFNRLIGLSNTFFRQIPKQSSSTYLKSQLGEVTQLLDAKEIPPRLTLDEQSLFAIGYFHQRQTYFTKRENHEQSN